MNELAFLLIARTPRYRRDAKDVQSIELIADPDKIEQMFLHIRVSDRELMQS